jgi:hypothetical protein
MGKIFKRTRVALNIYDYSGNLGSLSEELKLQPSAVYEEAAGQARRWQLTSGIAENKPVAEHLEALLAKLKPSASRLKSLSTRARCRISVGLESSEFNTELEMGHEMLQSLANLGVTLWLDIYNLSEDK